MRRESSTVVVLVGEAGSELLAELGRSPNVSVVRGPEGNGEGAAGAPAGAPRRAGGTGARAGAAPDRGGRPAAAELERPGWERGAMAMREAARRRTTYVLVPDDPLAGVATAWRAMWDVTAGPDGAAAFEATAADALEAWRGKRFELPDYYLVLAAPEHGVTGPDLHLGPLRALRPRRVAVVAASGAAAQAAALLASLRSLEQGPWWPPLGEVLDAARRFYAGGLTHAGGLPDALAAGAGAQPRSR